MTEPRRLVDDDDLARALIASTRDDAPSRHARDRTAATLGVSLGGATIAASGVAEAAGVATKTTAAKASAIGAVTTSGAGVATVAKVAATGIWVKAGIGGIVAMAAVSGSVVALQHTAAPVPLAVEAPTHAVAASARTETTEPPSSPAPPAAPATTASAPPAAPRKTASAPPPRASAMASAPPATSEALESPLTRELRSLDEARRALDQGNASGALAALDRHDRAFPAGTLQTEADILRTEALLARGDTVAARALASELLARDPSGPHARRLASIAGGK